MSKNTKYQFPSTLDIEHPLRRDFRTRNCGCIRPIVLAVLIALVLACTASYFIIGHKVDVQKARADKAIQEDNNFYASFCDQAKADHLVSGTKESEALRNLCG